MHRQSIIASFAAVAAIFGFSGDAGAQGRGGATSGFGGGSSAFGGSSFGGSSFGGSSFGGGGGGFGSSSLGTSSFGQSRLGGGGLGQSGFGQAGTGFNSAGGFGAGSTGGLGAGGANQPFVGRSAADAENFFGGLNQQFQNAVQRAQRAGMDSAGGAAASERRPEVRVRLVVSDSLSQSVAPVAPRLAAATESIADLLGRKGLGAVQLAAADGVVTLRGVVENESDRLVAQKLAEIEPGVDRVVNELTVAAAPELLPASR